MLWGLWMDAERIGSESLAAAGHPEWLAAAYDGQKRLGGLVDLTQPEAGPLDGGPDRSRDRGE